MRRWLGLLLAVSVIGLGPAVALDTEIENHRPVLLDAESYTEGWDQYYYFEDGTFLAVQFLISNYGPTDHRALVIGSLVPADGGKPLVIKNGRGRKDWSFDDRQLDLKVAHHRFSGTYPHYRLYLRNSRGEVDLTLEARVESWQLGHIPGPESGEFQYASYLMPMADARGRYRRGSESAGDAGRWQMLRNGRGFAIRYLNNSSLYKVSRSWIRLASIDSQDSSSPVFYLVQRLGDKRSSFLAIMSGGQIRQQWTRFPVTLITPDNDSPDEAEYDIEDVRLPPDAIQFQIAGTGGTVEGKITMTRLLQRFDFVRELKPLERFFVQFLNTPLHYRYLARYDLTYQGKDGGQQLTGTALAEIMTLKR
jgi:hypothetical protein